MRLILSLSLFLTLTQGIAFAQSLDPEASKDLKLLEQKYFEHTFDSDAVEQRVARVEQLIRGEAATGNPADRIKKIVADLTADGESIMPPPAVAAPAASNSNQKTAANTNKGSKQTPALSTAYDDQDDDDDSANAGPQSDYPHVTALEKEILGQTFVGQGLQTRLARMETKAFGAPIQNPDLSVRTDSLEKYAEKKLKAKPFGENPEMAAAEWDAASGNDAPARYSQQATRPGIASQIPKQVLQSLLGIPNFGPQAYAPRSQNVNEPPVVSDDDPLVFQQDPPPAGTQMRSRVGWCEVHTFGHTYPTLHLTQRLRQLNDAVRPASPKQSDMQLMDDVDLIIAAVQARKPHPDKVSARNAVPQ